MSVEKRRPPLTTILLWIGVLTLVLTGYGISTGVVLTLPFPYNILTVFELRPFDSIYNEVSKTELLNTENASIR